MQKEAVMIETDLERRFHAMQTKTQQQRYLPQSLTEEFDQYKVQLQEKSLTDMVNSIPLTGINKTREIVTQRLGGAFDYTQFSEDLRSLIVDKEAIERQFRSEALQTPEISKGPKVPDYDFSSSIFTKDLFGGAHSQKGPSGHFEERMSTQRPAYLD